ALIGPAPADVAPHRGVDIGIGRLWLLFEQCRGRHNLAALTVTALRDVSLPPANLHRVFGFRVETLDSDHGFAYSVLNGGLAAAHRGAVYVNSARSAKPHPTAELRTRQFEGVAQNPEQRHIRTDVDRAVLAVDIDCYSRHLFLLKE